MNPWPAECREHGTLPGRAQPQLLCKRKHILEFMKALQVHIQPRRAIAVCLQQAAVVGQNLIGNWEIPDRAGAAGKYTVQGVEHVRNLGAKKRRFWMDKAQIPGPSKVTVSHSSRHLEHTCYRYLLNHPISCKHIYPNLPESLLPRGAHCNERWEGTCQPCQARMQIHSGPLTHWLCPRQYMAHE